MLPMASAGTAPLQDLAGLIGTVQHNCDISDARHARDMTLCNYLLGMRELYRWEQDIALGQPIAKDALGSWIARREARWSDLEDCPFHAMDVAGQRIDAFDPASINRSLIAHGLVYSGGLGIAGKPHFFLAQLLRREERNGITVLVSGREYARDLLAPPASLRGDTIYLRQDALRRWLSEKTEAWSVRRPDSALQAALDCYGFAGDAPAALDEMVRREEETLILHEVGEAMAGSRLGPGWRAMLASLSSRRAEMLARAVRDNLADCLATLPALIEGGTPCSLHFYFSHLDGLRGSLFPCLSRAYALWRATGDAAALRDAVAAGGAHWEQVARALLTSHDEDSAAAQREMDARAGEHGALAL